MAFPRICARYGSWGHQEFTAQWPQAPKWRALQEFITAAQAQQRLLASSGDGDDADAAAADDDEEGELCVNE